MRHDRIAMQRAQRHAFGVLLAGSDAFQAVPAANITADAIIRQELEWSNGQQVYEFNFGSSNETAARSPILNNVLFGDNDLVSAYGVRAYFGLGANAINRQYFTTGIAGDDDSLYNGTLSVSVESTQPIEKMPMRDFRDEGPFGEYVGMQLWNPQRSWSGQLSKLIVKVDLLNSPAGLNFTPDLFVSVEVHCAIGQA